jgi:hypothetical protein
MKEFDSATGISCCCNAQATASVLAADNVVDYIKYHEICRYELFELELFQSHCTERENFLILIQTRQGILGCTTIMFLERLRSSMSARVKQALSTYITTNFTISSSALDTAAS